MTSASPKWYHGVTRYQWLVLIVASLGWVFDAFEGQLYNITRADMLPELLRVGGGRSAGETLGRTLPRHLPHRRHDRRAGSSARSRTNGGASR